MKKPKFTIGDRVITNKNAHFYGTITAIEGPLNGNEGTDGDYAPYFRYSIRLDDMGYAEAVRIYEWQLNYLEE